MEKNIKINVVSLGRRWLLDVARELEKQGYEVAFYTAVPYKRMKKFGLKKESSKSIFWIMTPFILLSKMFPVFGMKVMNSVFDYFVSLYMRNSDIYISDVNIHKKRCFRVAKKKSKFRLLESGSTHILNQKKLLENYLISKKMPNDKRYCIKKSDLEDELNQYKECDYILVPSKIVKQTYLENNYPFNKLFYNPYGVDLSKFYPLKFSKKEFDIIMTGSWCYRKGCDLIQQLCLKQNYSFLHIGKIMDMQFPESANMKHIEAVDQNTLIKYYAKAKIFVLPSREEGLALVQRQAIACGLPVVCSKFTGGKDIGEVTDLKEWIFEMKDFSLAALEEEVSKALIFCSLNKVFNRDQLDNISWEAYGRRYSTFIEHLFKNC